MVGEFGAEVKDDFPSISVKVGKGGKGTGEEL